MTAGSAERIDGRSVSYSWLLDLLQRVGPSTTEALVAEVRSRPQWADRDPESIRRHLHRLRARGRIDRDLLPVDVPYRPDAKVKGRYGTDQAHRLVGWWYAVDDMPYWFHPAMTRAVADYVIELADSGPLTDAEAATRLLVDADDAAAIRNRAGTLIERVDADSLFPAWTLTRAGRTAADRLR